MPNMQKFSSPMPSYFHKTVGGYHAAKLTRYNDLIERQLSKNNMAVLNMLNTRWVIVDEQQAQLNPEALGNAWWVDSLTYVNNADAEMKFLDNFNPATVAVADAKYKDVLGAAKPKQAGDTIFETTYAPNKLTYHTHSAQGGLAVFSEIYFPWGWKATIDGKEAKIGRVNYVLRALQLPAGDRWRPHHCHDLRPTRGERHRGCCQRFGLWYHATNIVSTGLGNIFRHSPQGNTRLINSGF